MPNRILKDSICTSENIAMLEPVSEVFWYRLLVQCDDFGRIDARPAILRAKCYPLALDRVSEEDIERWLNDLAQVGLIAMYTVDGKRYLQVVTWDKHQQKRAKHSKYPPMPEPDSNCNHVISDDSNGNQIHSRIENRESRIDHREAGEQMQSQANGATHDDDALIDPDFRQAVETWKEVFDGTPQEIVPPVAHIGKWLAYSGPEILCYMIRQAKGKTKPTGWLWQTYDNWRKDGEVAPYITKAVQQQKQTSSRPTVTHIINPITGQPEAIA